MQQPDPSEIGQEVTDPTPAGRDAIQRVQPEASTQQTGREAINRVQPEASTQQRGRDESRPYEHIPNGLRKDAHYVRFDWFAVGVVIIIAAVFAIAAHLNTQPATSLVPAAVLSATGCGLLVTALRKLRTFKGAGVFEAALGGLFLAIFQFISALSFPGVLQALSADPLSQPGFFTTWGLVAIFSIVFSMAGAALGHLAFAPLRPLPVRKSARSEPSDNELEAEDEMENAPESIEDTDQARDDESQDSEDAFVDEQLPQLAQSGQQAEQTSSIGEQMPDSATPARSGVSYLITILLLGLAPTLVGYVFAAAFDFALTHNQYLPGPFPTLRLLSALLPWQIPLPGPGIPSFILSQVWRIPLFFGNPSSFDIQALEPFLFNGAALGLLLRTTYGQDHQDSAIKLHWGKLLLLEAALGLVLVVPADLWIFRGIQGLVQFQGIAIPIRALEILNSFTFTLNLITGPLVCIIAGMAFARLKRA